MTTQVSEETMLQIGNTLVSLDLIERFFCCDLDDCKGACCIEGDAGAPITAEEQKTLREIYPLVRDRLLPASVEAVDRDGVAYIDEEGDLVTTIIATGNCAFSCYAPGGKCICALECAHREGLTRWRKPASCHLYPVRIKEYEKFTAVNFHRWKICAGAERLGRRLGMRAYKFLAEPLTARFGADWYAELCRAAEAYLETYGDTPAQ